MGVEKVRRRFAVKGKITIGGDVDITRSAADSLKLGSGDSLVDSQVTGGTVTLKDGRLQIGTVVGALGTTSTMPTNVPGLIRVGHSLGTIQLGIVHNGTTFVLEGTASGNVVVRANPAGT